MPCSSPLSLETVGGVVGCGRCRHCRVKRKSEKSARLFFESKTHESALFVTLTYNDRFLPREYINPLSGESFESVLGVLNPRDTRLFTLRLTSALKRMHGPSFKFRYFYVGEYGERHFRPHYHFVFFGLNDRDHGSIIRYCWSHPRTKEPYCDYDQLDIQTPRDEWHVSQYVCNYMLKKQTVLDDPRLATCTPEFSRSSKGLGLPYVSDLLAALTTPSAIAYIQRNADIPRKVVVNGKSLPIDRYMRGKLLDALQISDKVKSFGQEKFSQEMQDLLSRAALNPEIPKTWLVGTKRHWALTKQYIVETAQQCLNSDAKAALFAKERKL